MQIVVYHRHKQVFEGDFDGPVELGRQDPATGESPFSSNFKNNQWRVAIAAADQKALSRKHLLVEPLAGNRAKITNLGQMAVHVSRGGELQTGTNREAALPLLVTIDSTAIRVGGEEIEAGLQSLGEATRLPVSVIVRTPSQIERLIAANSFVDEAAALPRTVHVTFLAGPASQAGLAAIGKLQAGATEVEAGKLGKLKVVNGSEVLLGPPFVYNKDNIDQFDF